MTDSLLAAVIDAAAGAGTSAPSPSVPDPSITALNADAAHAAGEAAGRAAERARIQAIMSSDEANGRATLAAHLAFSTDTSAAAAIDLLRMAGKETVPTLSRLDGLVPDPRISMGALVPPEAESSLQSAVERFNAARRG